MTPHTNHFVNRRAAARRILISASLLLLSAGAARAQQPPQPCAEFQKTVKATYDFKPSRLKDEAERTAKSAAMDRVWEAVKAQPAVLLPCLRAALADPQADPWFRFDGSNLLVSLDPSPASKAEQVRQYTAVDLGDVHPGVWVSTLARRGAEGFDVSEAGARWLDYPKAAYNLPPQHGAREVNQFLAAFFIYGSMDEAHATPALLKIATDANNPSREKALAILLFQATPASFEALKAANKVGRAPEAQAALLKLLADPRRVEPRAEPKTSREQFLKAFEAYLNGDARPFAALVREVPDGEKDAVAVLKPEDVPLVRKFRRAMIATANPHAFEYYKVLTDILMTLVWRPEMVK